MINKWSKMSTVINKVFLEECSICLQEILAYSILRTIKSGFNKRFTKIFEDLVLSSLCWESMVQLLISVDLLFKNLCSTGDPLIFLLV